VKGENNVYLESLKSEEISKAGKSSETSELN
jgi:hypothetical protein